LQIANGAKKRARNPVEEIGFSEKFLGASGNPFSSATRAGLNWTYPFSLLERAQGNLE